MSTLFSILDSEQEKDEGTRVIERAKGNRSSTTSPLAIRP